MNNPHAALLSLLFALTLGLAGCGADAGSGGGTSSQDTAAPGDATDGGGSDNVDAVGGGDAPSGGADAVSQTDTGARTGADAGPKPATPADIVKLANAAVAAWADDATQRVAFMPESQTMKELDSADCPKGDANCGGGDSYDPKEAAADVKEWFSGHLFNQALADVKLSTDTSAVFCLKAEDLCDSEPDAQGNEVVDAKCAAGLAKVPLCLAVYVFDGDVLKGELRVGLSPQVVPATFVLSPTQLSAEADLAKALQAAKMITAAIGEELPEGFPALAQGKLSLTFTRDAAGDALSGGLAVLESAHVSAYSKGDKRFYEVKLAQAAKAVQVLFGKDQQAVAVKVALGALDLGVATDLLLGEGEQDCGGSAPGGAPGGDPCGVPAKPKTGSLHLAVPGVTLDLTLVASKTKDSATLTGFGLGDKSVTATFDDGAKVHPLGALDLNAASTPPRVVNATVVYADGQVKLEATPELHAVVKHSLAVIAPQFGDDVPEFLHAGQSSVRLDGASVPAMEFGDKGGAATPKPAPGKDPGATGGGVDDDFAHMKVLAGLLTLKASGLAGGAADVMLTIKAGFCMAEADGGSDKPQHVFAQLQQAACK